MKYLWLILFLPLLALAQAPPVQRQIFTTNTNPYIEGTNGVGVSSNRANGRWLIDGRNLTNGLGSGLSAFSNNVSLTSAATNFDFYNFLSLTQANNKVSIGTGFQNMTNTGSANFSGNVTNYGQERIRGGLTVDTYIFDNDDLTVVRGTTTGTLTNQGYFTNTGPANFAGQVTNWNTVRNKAGVTNDSNVRTVGAVENQSTITNTGAANFAAPVTNWSTLTQIGNQTNNGALNITGPARHFGAVTNEDLTASTVMSVNANKKETSIPNGTGALTNDNAGNFGWFNSFLTAATAGFSLFTNTFATADRVGGSTNFVVLGANGVTLKGTNTASGNGTNSLEIGLNKPLVDPFIVIDNVAYYPTNPWTQVLYEEWNGDVTQAAAGVAGSAYWTIVNSGNTISRVGPLTESGHNNYISIALTNTGTAASYFIGNGVANVGSYLLATNAEIIFTARIRIGLTNTAAEVQRMLVGLSASTGVTEPTSGIYIGVNTNVATNSFVLCTSRASSRTITYSQHSANSWTPMVWINVGFRLDATGTNVIFFTGSTLTNMTAVATNQANVPDSVLTGPTLVVHRVTDTTHALRLTNYCDNMRMWVRQTSGNY